MSAPASAVVTARETTPTEYQEDPPESAAESAPESAPESGTFGSWASHTLAVKVCADKTRREWEVRLRTYTAALWSMPIETITLAQVPSKHLSLIHI